MSAACVCMVEGKWRCGVHGVITPAMRAAARAGRDVGEAQRTEQEDEREPVAAEVHPGPGSLL